MKRRVVVSMLALALAELPAQATAVDLRHTVGAVEAGEGRLTALSELQDRGQLDAATVITALHAGGELARMAAAIVRHEWTEVPAELLDGITDDHAALHVLLHELALAPRPSLLRWVRGQLEGDKLPIGTRCLALAATGEELTRQQAAMLVNAATEEELGEGYRTAIWLLPSGIADGLLGRLHGLMMHEGADLSRLMPFFDRLSDQGLERLLGLVATLPAEARRELARYFVAREVPAYRRRAEAALDGKIPLDAVWLMRADELLDRRGRIERLLAVLVADAPDPLLAEVAFRNLIAAGVFEPPVLAWAEQTAQRPRRIRRLLEAGVEQLGVEPLLAWLDSDLQVATAVAGALARRPVLEPELEAALRRRVTDVVVTGPAMPFAVALLQRGRAETVTAVWPELRASPMFSQFVDTLSRRREPWVHALLLTEAARVAARDEDEEQRQRQLDAVRLGLAALGDRRELAGLVAAAHRSPPGFVRRCSHYASPLSREHSLRLLADAAALEDEDLAVELVAWAAATRDDEVEQQLLAIWNESELSERHLAALRGLAAGARRPQFEAALRAALQQGALDDRHDALCYELIGTMSMPLRRADVELLAELAITSPLFDAVAERRRAARWPDGRFGFPLVATVAHRLRGCDPELAQAVFAAAAARARTHDDVAALARSRLVVLWRNLQPDPEVQWAVGKATAGLLLALPPADHVGEGLGHLFAMAAAEDAGDWDAAAAHARRAVARLLRWSTERQNARLFLGERDPGAGLDPFAALAAQPFLLTARRASPSDDDFARVSGRWLGLAREFAGRDVDTLQEIDRRSKD